MWEEGLGSLGDPCPHILVPAGVKRDEAEGGHGLATLDQSPRRAALRLLNLRMGVRVGMLHEAVHTEYIQNNKRYVRST